MPNELVPVIVNPLTVMYFFCQIEKPRAPQLFGHPQRLGVSAARERARRGIRDERRQHEDDEADPEDGRDGP